MPNDAPFQPDHSNASGQSRSATITVRGFRSVRGLLARHPPAGVERLQHGLYGSGTDDCEVSGEALLPLSWTVVCSSILVPRYSCFRRSSRTRRTTSSPLLRTLRLASTQRRFRRSQRPTRATRSPPVPQTPRPPFGSSSSRRRSASR